MKPAPTIRHRVDPADVPPEKAARRLCLTEARFLDVLPRLLARGFPPADPDTGMYDLDAIDAWRRRRHPALFGLTGQPDPGEAPKKQGFGDRFCEAEERGRHGRPA